MTGRIFEAGAGPGGSGGGGGITVLPDGGHPPTPNAGTVGRIYEDPLNPGHVWIGIRTRISRVPPSLTAADFAHSDYLGAHASDPPGEIDHFYFNTHSNLWKEFVITNEGSGLAPMISSRWVTTAFNDLDPYDDNHHWLGARENTTAAAEVLDSRFDGPQTGQTYHFYNQADSLVETIDNSSYVAPEDSHYVFDYSLFSESRGGFIVDVSDTHHPPTPNELNARDIYIDRTQTPPRVWVPHEHAAPDTAPSLTSTAIAADTEDFRGVAYVNPATGVTNDFYWNRNRHTWRLRRADTHWYAVSWTELKMQAMAGNDPFFESDAVFLNEVQSDAQAAQIIENAGNYDSSRDYYYIRGNNFYEVDTFTEAVNNNFFHDYSVLGDREPETIFEDTVDFTWVNDTWREVALSRNLGYGDRNRKMEFRLYDSTNDSATILAPFLVDDWLELAAKLTTEFDSSKTIGFQVRQVTNDDVDNQNPESIRVARKDATTLLVYPSRIPMAGDALMIRIRLL